MVKEALSNAIYHRGYDVREPIEVHVEKDRIEIVNFPGLDRSVTQGELKNYKFRTDDIAEKRRIR